MSESQRFTNFPPCSCGSGFQVAYMCTYSKCPFFKKQQLYCDSCISEDVHDHTTKRINRITGELYFVAWLKLYSDLIHLKEETNKRYVDGLEELVGLCEGHLIQGSGIDGDLLSSQIDMLNNTAIQVGEIFEDQIIPLTKLCKCVELEELQGGLVNLQKFLADHSYLANIDLEWIYKPYRGIFNKSVPNLPSELSQNTINLFTQLQIRSINEDI